MADGNVSVTVAGRFIGGGLFTARAKHEGKPAEYNAVIVLDDEEYAKVKAARDQAVAEKWGKKIPPGVKDYTDQTGDDPEMASFEKQYINPKSKSLDRNGSPKAGPKTLVKRGGVLMPTTQGEGVIYPGCYVAASITVYAVDGDKAKSIPPCISTSWTMSATSK